MYVVLCQTVDARLYMSHVIRILDPGELIWCLARKLRYGWRKWVWNESCERSCGNNYQNNFVYLFFVHCLQSKGLQSHHEVISQLFLYFTDKIVLSKDIFHDNFAVYVTML
jgi:hypothetical protein